jgi:type II secretory pathway pseudopilin PulG
MGRRMRRGSASPAGQRGFTYLMVMALVALLGLGLAALGPMWSDATQRERERELLRVGALYADAIASYYKRSPGSLKSYPPKLESLISDTRFVGVKRHLRKLYADPLNPAQGWGVVAAPDGGVMGIYSMDRRKPFLQTAVDLGSVVMPVAATYSDWKFMPKVQP